MLPTQYDQLVVTVYRYRLERGAEREFYGFRLLASSERPNPISEGKDRKQDKRIKMQAELRDVMDSALRYTSTNRPTPLQGELKKAGFKFWDFVPPQIREQIFASDRPLLIETDDPIFPWEILYNKQQFLGEIRPIGRLTAIRPADQGAGTWRGRRHAVLVGNPHPYQTSLPMLKGPPEEVAKLDQILKGTVPTYTTDLLDDRRLTKQGITASLDVQAAIFHYGGHILRHKGEQDDEEVQGSVGMVSSDGQEITADDVRRSGGRFLFVFLNGCRSGLVEEVQALAAVTGAQSIASLTSQTINVAPILEGLAMAFREKGALAVVSTLWEVEDAYASAFAIAVYQLLAAGKSIGTALKETRQAFILRYPGDLNWAAYVLYGDPTLTLESMQSAFATEKEDKEIELPVLPDHLQPGGPRRDDAALETFSGQHDAFDDDPIPDALPPPIFSEIEPPPSPPAALDPIDHLYMRLTRAPQLPLAPDGRAVLEKTLEWIVAHQWDSVARFDVLVGLARIDDSPLIPVLQTLGLSRQRIEQINDGMFGTGPGVKDGIKVSRGVGEALDRAAQLARQRGEGAVTAQHIMEALLATPLTGTIHQALETYAGVEGAQITAALQRQRPAASPAAPLAVDSAARALKDLRDIEILHRKRNDALPLVDRPEMHELLQLLREPGDHHVLLHGAIGSGRHSLVTLLVRYALDRRGMAELGEIDGWGFFRVLLAPNAPDAGKWLTQRLHDLVQMQGPAVLVFDDLVDLLAQPDIAAVFPEIFATSQLRCLALTTTSALPTLRQRHHGLMRRLNPLELPLPRPEVVRSWLAARQMMLEAERHITFQPQALDEAVRLATDARTQLAMPGRAEELLLVASAVARKERESTSSAAGETNSHGIPTVTADHVRRAVDQGTTSRY